MTDDEMSAVELAAIIRATHLGIAGIAPTVTAFGVPFAAVPLPPETLINALQDRIHPTSGKLISAKKILATKAETMNTCPDCGSLTGHCSVCLRIALDQERIARLSTEKALGIAALRIVTAEGAVSSIAARLHESALAARYAAGVAEGVAEGERREREACAALLEEDAKRCRWLGANLPVFNRRASYYRQYYDAITDCVELIRARAASPRAPTEAPAALEKKP